jgi:hypothetical protein
LSLLSHRMWADAQLAALLLSRAGSYDGPRVASEFAFARLLSPASEGAPKVTLDSKTANQNKGPRGLWTETCNEWSIILKFTTATELATARRLCDALYAVRCCIARHVRPPRATHYKISDMR